MRSSDDGGVDKKAEKPKPPEKNSGGTAKVPGMARQASTARGENAGSEDEALFDEVLRRDQRSSSISTCPD